MKLRIKELCRQRGIRMTDIAKAIGVDYSNLLTSLKGNPTLQRLSDVADALGVPITELFEKGDSPSSDRSVEANGDILPAYDSVRELCGELERFVRENVNHLRMESSMWGIIGGDEAFSLSAICEAYQQDGEYLYDKVFILSFLRSGETFKYDLLDHMYGTGYDLDSERGIIRAIRKGMEGVVEN